MDDRKTVQEVLSGNREAYRELVERYEKGLFMHVYAMVGDQDLAEDICQESFIKAYQSLRSYKPVFSFSTWLYKIAHNLTISSLRKKGALSLDDIGETPSGQSLAHEYEKRSEKEMIRQAVSTLPMNYQTVISLYYWQDMSYEEIAEVVGVPVGTVRTWLHRAKQSLKEKIDGRI